MTSEVVRFRNTRCDIQVGITLDGRYLSFEMNAAEAMRLRMNGSNRTWSVCAEILAQQSSEKRYPVPDYYNLLTDVSYENAGRKLEDLIPEVSAENGIVRFTYFLTDNYLRYTKFFNINKI